MARAKNYHLGRPSIGFVWVKASRTFEPTEWAMDIEADAATYGNAEAGRRHPFEEGENKGKPVSERSVQRILNNLELHQEGRLIPNGLSQVRYGYKPVEAVT